VDQRDRMFKRVSIFFTTIFFTSVQLSTSTNPHPLTTDYLSMNNNNQKQQQQPDNSDSNKKESTNSGGNDETSTSSSKPKDILHEDLCSICFDDVSILDIHSFTICTECGKVMHKKCDIQLMNAKGLSAETRNSCPMCRATIVALGSKEQIERLQKWSQLGKAWAQSQLGGLYRRGRGVNIDPKMACKWYKLAADQGHHNAQFNLGLMYKKGEGVIQSNELAFLYIISRKK